MEEASTRPMPGWGVSSPQPDARAAGETTEEEDDSEAKVPSQTSGSLLRRLIYNTWAFETLAMLFSALTLIAIAVVLWVYDNKTRPHMPYGMNLNAIVAILATASKSSLLCAVTGVISQLKWTWFQVRGRRLHDIQTFDDASRGPIGAVALLISRTRNSVASIGAIITILALVFNPFVQQIISYPVQHVSDTSQSATIQRASAFITDPSSLDFAVAMNRGLWSSTSDFRKPFCPSGDCNWPPFQSLGWCSRYIDASALAQFHGTCEVSARQVGANGSCALSLGSGGHGKIMHLAPDQEYGEIAVTLVDEMVWTIKVIGEVPHEFLTSGELGRSRPLNCSELGVRGGSASSRTCIA